MTHPQCSSKHRQTDNTTFTFPMQMCTKTTCIECKEKRKRKDKLRRLLLPSTLGLLFSGFCLSLSLSTTLCLTVIIVSSGLALLSGSPLSLVLFLRSRSSSLGRTASLSGFLARLFGLFLFFAGIIRFSFLLSGFLAAFGFGLFFFFVFVFSLGFAAFLGFRCLLVFFFGVVLLYIQSANMDILHLILKRGNGTYLRSIALLLADTETGLAGPVHFDVL